MAAEASSRRWMGTTHEQKRVRDRSILPLAFDKPGFPLNLLITQFSCTLLVATGVVRDGWLRRRWGFESARIGWDARTHHENQTNFSSFTVATHQALGVRCQAFKLKFDKVGRQQPVTSPPALSPTGFNPGRTRARCPFPLHSFTNRINPLPTKDLDLELSLFLVRLPGDLHIAPCPRPIPTTSCHFIVSPTFNWACC